MIRLTEEKIRPRALFEEYMRLAEVDSELYFGKCKRVKIMCPACGREGKDIFNKHSHAYQECPKCSTIFVSPRPIEGAYKSYYTESKSAAFFANKFYKETEIARRDTIIVDKASYLTSFIKKLNIESYCVVDIGGGTGLFAEVLRKLSGADVIIIEPNMEAAQVCRSKGFNVIQTFLETVDRCQLPSKRKVFVSFELFEHLYDTNIFLEKLVQIMNPGDYFIFSTLSGAGVDIRALWDKSDTFSVQHLNFFNPNSIVYLLERHGLLVHDVVTPGKLDIDILCQRREKIHDRSWRYIVDNCTEDQLADLQKVLKQNKLSSHMLVYTERV